MSTTEATSEKSAWFWIILIAFFLMFLLIFGCYLRVGGQVSGEEFSPDDFSRRRFSYNVMPIFDVVLKGVTHHSSASVLEQTLVTDGWITPVTKTPQTWHLVSDSISDPNSPDFDASILVQLLSEQNSEHEQVWQIWTDDRPKDAKVLWPAVAELARAELYWAIPDIMQLAADFDTDGDPEFESGLDARVSRAFYLNAESLREAESHPEAIENYSAAIKRFKFKEAFVGRAASRTASGESGGQSDETESKQHPSYAESIENR